MTNDQLNRLYSKIADELDISDTHFERAETSYSALGKYIGNHTEYAVDVYTQGSFRLGTVVRPLSDEDDYDLDLVCEITDGHGLSAKSLKQDIGTILRDSKRYSSNLTEKKRCWRIDYADEAQFHMDIIPAIPLASHGQDISITDKKVNGEYSYIPSNPKGYAEWFDKRNVITQRVFEKAMAYDEANIEPVKRYGAKKPLQKAIQILKRHRDIMFEDSDDIKPVSIIITTLAAHSYGGEAGVYDTIKSVLETMNSFIEKRGNSYFIPNPSMPSENFADKWNTDREKASAFFRWHYAATQVLVVQSLSIEDDYGDLESALGHTTIERAISALETRADSTVTALAPYKEQSVKVALQVLHRQRPPFRLPKTPTLAITAKVTEDGKQYAYKNNDAAIPKGCTIDFRLLGSTKLFRNGYTVKWQVVNTGDEAREANCLRGGFETKPNDTTWQESTQYTGIHYVQAFLLKRDSCIAKSREFIVNIQ